MNATDSPQRPQRSSNRHQLQLPVSLKFANRELCGQSENISANGILLSSAFLIPEGSAVEMAVRIVRSRPGTFLSGRGKVVRAEPRGTGDFALAVKLDNDFDVGKGSQLPQAKSRVVASIGPHLALAWHTET
jgi:PilZ domain